MEKFVRHTVLPVIAAAIWGFAFSAQSICADYLPAFSINTVRSLLSFAVLAAACLILRIKPGEKKDLIRSSFICGVPFFLAANSQQFGIGETSAGKSGFITTLYIVLVPVLYRILFKKKTTPRVRGAVAIALAGMFLLCVNESFRLEIGDAALLFCALMYAAQILGIDYYSGKVHPVALSAGQFLVNGVLSGLCSLIFESISPGSFLACLPQLLYVALMSSCVAYTLQIIAQKGGNATVVTLLLSLESVFAVIGGAVFLGERLSGRELAGCALMAAAIVIAQLPERKTA